jgi:hypothetical protein
VYEGCKQLSQFDFSTVISIGERAFYGSGLRKIGLLSLAQAIPAETFSTCSHLVEVNASLNVKKGSPLGKSVFHNCKSLEHVAISANWNDFTLNSKVFGGSINLHSISLTGTGTFTVDDKCFSGHSNLNEFNFALVDGIGSEAFAGTGLHQATISGEIGSSAFANCIALQHVFVNGAGLTLGDGAFQDCQLLDSVSVTKKGSKLKAGSVVIGATVFSGCITLNNVVLPGLSSIGDSAFWACANLASFDFAGVSTLGNWSFAGSGIVNVKLDKSVRYIGQGAFVNCSRLKSVEIDGTNQAVTLGSSAFRHCLNLVNVTLKNCLFSIPNYTFSNCTRLRNFGWTTKEGPNISLGSYAFAATGLRTFIVPSNVSTIGHGAFGWIENLSSITFAGSPRTVEPDCFVGCHNLTTIDTPDCSVDGGLCGALNYSGFPRSSDVKEYCKGKPCDGFCGRPKEKKKGKVGLIVGVTVGCVAVVVIIIVIVCWRVRRKKKDTVDTLNTIPGILGREFQANPLPLLSADKR